MSGPRVISSGSAEQRWSPIKDLGAVFGPYLRRSGAGLARRIRRASAARYSR